MSTKQRHTKSVHMLLLTVLLIHVGMGKSSTTNMLTAAVTIEQGTQTD